MAVQTRRRTVARLTATIVAAGFMVSGCLLVVPEPTIEEIDDRTVTVGEELEVEIAANGGRRDVELTYEIDDGGWVPIDGSVFRYTFDEPGRYKVTVTASNGLRSVSTVFTITVKE